MFLFVVPGPITDILTIAAKIVIRLLDINYLKNISFSIPNNFLLNM
jgi:hypothetical protein